MERRDAIKRAAILLGGTIALPNILKAWENPTILNPDFYLTPAQEALLAEVAETIIPTTGTPGAKAAGVAPFIIKILADCSPSQMSGYMMESLAQLDSDTKARFGAGFVETTPENRITMLQVYEQKAKDEREPFNAMVKSWNLAPGVGVAPFFPTMKNLTITGYFTSEIGSTQALRYDQIPRRYETIDYKKGDKIWAG
jgi:hypothetical protein